MLENPLENQPIQKPSFWRFWGACIWFSRKGSWKDFDHLNNFAALLFAIWLVVAWWLSRNRFGDAKGGVTEEQMTHWAVIVPAVLFVIAFGVRLVYAPYKKFKELVETNAEQDRSHEERTNKLATTFEQMEARLVKLHAQEKGILESQIQDLKSQLDDRDNRKKIEGQLGEYHIMIQRRRHAIRAMLYFEYTRTYESSFNQGCFDEDTRAIMSQIETFLSQEVKGASLAIFQNTTNLKLTEIHDPGPLGDKHRFWQAIIDHLDHRASQLMKIIEDKK